MRVKPDSETKGVAQPPRTQQIHLFRVESRRGCRCRFFFDIQKEYSTGWINGLWKKKVENDGKNGTMWRILRRVTEYTKSADMRDGE